MTAVVKTAITAAENALFNADMPLLIENKLSSNRQNISTVYPPIWTGNSVDKTNTTYPTRNCYDGFPCYATSPTAVSTTTFYLYFTMNTAVEFDCVGLIGGNCSTLSMTDFSIIIDKNNNGLYTDAYIVTIKTSFADDKRFFTYFADRYSNVKYFVVYFRRATDFTTVPTVGELIIGRRYQMKTRPQNPFSPYYLESVVESSQTKSGLITNTSYAKNRFRLDANFQLHESAYVTDARNFFAGSMEQFAWVWQPYTAPNDWHLMTRDKHELQLPSSDYTESTFNVSGVEQGPENYYLKAGMY